MLRYIYCNQRLWVISFTAWNPQVTTFDLFLPINSEQFTSGRGWWQNFLTRLIKSCGLAVADFKNYEVADLRLRTSRIRKLRTCGCGFKNLEKSLRTCGCGLRKLKFGCGFADCGLKKKLAVPSTGINCTALLILAQNRKLGKLRELQFQATQRWRHILFHIKYNYAQPL